MTRYGFNDGVQIRLVQTLLAAARGICRFSYDYKEGGFETTPLYVIEERDGVLSYSSYTITKVDVAIGIGVSEGEDMESLARGVCMVLRGKIEGEEKRDV